MTSMRALSQSFAASSLAFALIQSAHHAGSGHPRHPFVAFFFHLGLVGLFLVSVVDSSFIPLPIPGVTDVMIVLYAAQHANVILLVLIGTLGSAAGGLFSHAVGQAGGMAFLEKHVRPSLLARVTRWVENHTVLAVAVPAVLPPPMPLSPFVLVAGAVRMSRRKFMIAFTTSRLVRHALAAWLGVHYGRQVLHIWTAFTDRWGTPILIVLWTVILLFTGIGIWRLYRSSRGMNLHGPQRLPHTLADDSPA